VADEDRPQGFAIMWSDDRSGRAYLCDPINHCIDVVDERARPLFSFGGVGSLRGQFHEPADVAIVSVDPSGAMDEDSAILAVADCGNHRVQFFELDGAPLVSLDTRSSERALSGWPSRSGWPFFRLAATPHLVQPSRLVWRPPFLDVTTAGGAIVRLNVLSALMPDFNDWLLTTGSGTLRQALNHFLQEPYRDEIPGSCLQRIAERLRSSTADVMLGRPA
jgi:hypothetical protein